MTEPKKISFGFSKLSKKSNLIIKPVVEEKKVELIECLEEKSIKIKDAVVVEFKPLVIPMQGDTNTLADRIRNTVKGRTTDNKKETVETDERPDSELTLDELAARQLIQEAKKFEITPNAVKVHTLPITEDKLALEGSKESTLDDYENVPIGDYGLAMLRGMGWSEDSGIGKTKKVSLIAAPELRPKGMGLGANKMVNSEIAKKPAVDRDGKEITLIKGAYAKIIAGKEKGNYCMVQGLDDEAGRVIVKTALGGVVLSLNEFLLVPVTPEEYSKSSKILNNLKYEEFMKKEKKEDNVKHNRIKEEKTSRKARSKSPPDIKPIKRTDKDESRSEKKKYESNSDDYNKKKEFGNSKSRDRNQDKKVTTISSDSEDYDNKYKNKSKDFETKRITNKKDKRSKRDKSRSRSRNSKKDKYKRSSSSNSESSSEYESKSDKRDRSRNDDKKSKHKKKSKKTKKSRSRKNSESSDSEENYKKHKKSSRHRKDSSSDSDDDKYRKDRRNRR